MKKISQIVGWSFLTILLLFGSQLITTLLLNLFPLKDASRQILYTIIFLVLVVVFSKSVYKFILKEPLLFGEKLVVKRSVKWIIIGMSLPLLLNVVTILVSSGSWFKNTQPEVIYFFSSTIFGLAISAGVGEEILYRGFLFNYVKKTFGLVAAVLIPSIIFALSHVFNGKLDFSSFLMLIIAGTSVGIMFSMIRIYTNSIWYGVIVHTLWDLLAATSPNNFLVIGPNPTISDSFYSYKLFDSSLFLFGGDYGIETSIIAIMIYLSVSLILFVKIKKY